MALFVQNIFIEKVILEGGKQGNEPVEPAAETDIIERNQFLTGFSSTKFVQTGVCVCSAVVVEEGVKFVSFDDCVKEVQGRKCYPPLTFLKQFFLASYFNFFGNVPRL